MSILRPIGWSSVVAGKWNPAILSPNGIARIIFQKPEDTPVEVFVPIDSMGPTKVRSEGVNVSADFNRLAIECENSDWETFEMSRALCIRAIDALPVTPLSAVGYNIRFELDEPEDGLIELLKPPLDDRLSDSGFTISERKIGRSVEWNGGQINLLIIKKPDSLFRVLLNFDMKSTANDAIKSWLEIPIGDVAEITNRIVYSTLDISEKETL